MDSSGRDEYKVGYHLHKNETIPLCLPITKLRSVEVEYQNNKGLRTEPWGTPNSSLQRSESRIKFC